MDFPVDQPCKTRERLNTPTILKIMGKKPAIHKKEKTIKIGSILSYTIHIYLLIVPTYLEHK